MVPHPNGSIKVAIAFIAILPHLCLCSSPTFSTLYRKRICFINDKFVQHNKLIYLYTPRKNVSSNNKAEKVSANTP